MAIDFLCPGGMKTNFTSIPTNQTAKMSSLSVFTISLHGLFSSIGIIENLLILGVVGFHVRRSVISIWILNLAASDLLATASLPFFTLYMARGSTWTLGPTFCRIHSSIFFLNMFVSGSLLAAISFDRCLVVLRPVWAQNHRTIHLVGKVCGVIWGFAVICTIPFYLFRDTITLPTGKILCYYNYARFLPSDMKGRAPICKQRKEALAFFKLFLAFLIPLAFIILSYIAVNSGLARRGCRRPYRFVRLVVAVVVSFVLCWAPYHFFIILEIMTTSGSPAQKLAGKALPISATIGFLNSVLNPILYVFSCPDLCSKIRHSLGAVMESVLVEDLAELARRRSTARSSISTSETALKPRNSLPALYVKEEDQTQVESLADVACWTKMYRMLMCPGFYFYFVSTKVIIWSSIVILYLHLFLQRRLTCYLYKLRIITFQSIPLIRTTKSFQTQQPCWETQSSLPFWCVCFAVSNLGGRVHWLQVWGLSNKLDLA